MQVRIYQPTKSAMQSGENKNGWLLEFIASSADKFIEPVMGWNASKNMMNEVKIKFSSLENAINFAKSKNYQFEVTLPQPRKLIKKNYASNFL